VNEERNDFQTRLLLIVREAEALMDTLPPGVSRTRAQHIATTARLLQARLHVAAPLIVSPAVTPPPPKSNF
jgi:hypothetical protein